MSRRNRDASKLREIAQAFREYGDVSRLRDAKPARVRQAGFVALEVAAENLPLLRRCKETFGYSEPPGDSRFERFKVLETWAAFGRVEKAQGMDDPGGPDDVVAWYGFSFLVPPSADGQDPAETSWPGFPR